MREKVSPGMKSAGGNSTIPVAWEVAFERGLPCDREPQDLWRLVSIRNLPGRTILHVSWFVSEAAATSHSAWIGNGRGRVLTITHYRICNQFSAALTTSTCESCGIAINNREYFRASCAMDQSG
jgi:hypothetical protein